MATLLVDAGNTSIKWAYLKNGETSNQHYYLYDGKAPISVFSILLNQKLEGCTEVLMVSVLGDKFNHEAMLMAKNHSILFSKIKSQSELSKVKNAYDEPEKLGSDRFVAMIAAYHLANKEELEKKPCIIIDSGTATTIDAIDSSGLHLGGLILPGVGLCQSSLLNNTEQLLQWSDPSLDITPTLFAKETTTAIISASIYGLAGAIDSICNKMEKNINNQNGGCEIKKFICGGNAKKILPYMDSHYLYQEDLIMLGLRTILETEQVNWH